MGEGSERLVREIQLLKVEPGDVLVVKIDADEDGDIEAGMEVFERALDHVGLADKVACVFHNGNVELQHVRFD